MWASFQVSRTELDRLGGISHARFSLQIQAIILRETGWLTLCGVVVGLLVTLASIRTVASMLYGLTPKDRSR